MRIVQQGGRLNVTDIDELSARTSGDFGACFRDALGAGVQEICVDLAGTGLVDCHGLGALVALRNHFQSKPRSIQVVNASRSARRILELSGLAPLLANDGSANTRPDLSGGARSTLESPADDVSGAKDPATVAALFGAVLLQAGRVAAGPGV